MRSSDLLQSNFKLDIKANNFFNDFSPSIHIITAVCDRQVIINHVREACRCGPINEQCEVVCSRRKNLIQVCEENIDERVESSRCFFFSIEGGGRRRLQVLLVRGHTQRERMKERKEFGENLETRIHRQYAREGEIIVREGQGYRSISNVRVELGM